MALDYFTIAEVRALKGMSDASRFTDAKITAAGQSAQALVERACGNVSFVGREVVELVDGTGGTSLLLRKAYVLSVTSVVMNGITLTDTYLFKDGVVERRPSGTFISQPWTCGRSNITVTYQAGYTATPPSDLKDALLEYTRHKLLVQDAKSGVSDRALSITNEFGNIQMASANTDHPTGLPDVDAVIMGWARTVNTVTAP